MSNQDFFGGVLVLQEFDVEVDDKKGLENLVASHFSCLETPIVQDGKINEEFPDEKILSITFISRNSFV